MTPTPAAFVIELRRAGRCVASLADHFATTEDAIAEARAMLADGHGDSAVIYRGGIEPEDVAATLPE